MARYLSLRCRLPADAEDRLAGLLGRYPVLGSTISGIGDGRFEATVYAEAGRAASVEGLSDELVALGAASVDSEIIEGQDWLLEYRARALPFRVGRTWWVDPQLETPSAVPEGLIRIGVEPSTAFGSGSHESTQLMLLALEESLVEGESVLDVGTGSGILALAADALGARVVVGLDRDPEAVWVARRIASQQVWPASPLYLVGPVGCLGGVGFGLILCNMITAEFTPLLPELHRLLASGGTLALAGALASEREIVLRAVEVAGMRIVRERELGEWIGLEARRG